MLRPNAMPADAGLPRRSFAQAALAGLAVSGVASRDLVAAERASAARAVSEESLIRSGVTILFQGDSITDAGRSREAAAEANSPAALGGGYAWLAAAQLLVDRPDEGLKVFNRGISGNKVFQLAERWQQDCLDLKPDVLSLLIGVNDFWHQFNGEYDGTVEKYEADYRELLRRTREALPQVKLVVCEPFVLRCGAVSDRWFPEFDRYREAACRLAKEAGAVAFVPFQAMFDAATKIAPPERWAGDGVHPSADGAALMAHAWRRAVDAA